MTLLDPFDNEAPAGARTTDPATSHAAALTPFRRGTHRHVLLTAYGEAGDTGLTDEEAAKAAKVWNGAWKRCSELRGHEFIKPTGETRDGSSGVAQRVCAITFAGKRALGLLAS